LQALAQAATGTAMADVRDAITTYAVVTVIIAVHAFAVVQPHVVVIVLCGQVLQLILTQVIKATTAVMQDLPAAGLLDRGFGQLAAPANQHVILLPKVLVCQAVAQVPEAEAALAIFVDSRWEHQTACACVLRLHTLQATDLQIV
jgi:hypothetical protein